jgi:hypothetical protein
MKYLKKINNEIIYPYSIDNLKTDYPNTSFPDNITENLLLEFDVYYVYSTNVPYDHTKNYIESTPNLINGKYYQNLVTEDATVEEVDQRLNGQWNIVRQLRNQYLLESDWTQLQDTPFAENKREEWVQYRQLLRDITAQSDPFNIIWPTKPQ